MWDLDLPYSMMLSAHASPQRKRHVDQLSCVSTDDRRVSLYFIVVCLFPGPHVIRGSLGTPESKATQSFHFSTNSFATIKSLSVRLQQALFFVL